MVVVGVRMWSRRGGFRASVVCVYVCFVQIVLFVWLIGRLVRHCRVQYGTVYIRWWDPMFTQTAAAAAVGTQTRRGFEDRGSSF